MIDLEKSLPDNNLTSNGIIHIGGHLAQEYDEYKKIGVKHQIWVEANPTFYYQIVDKLKHDKDCLVLNYAIFDEEKEVDFGVANNGASSSILPLKNHLKYYPNINYDGYIKITTKRLDTIIKEHNINLNNYDGLVMDVQGVELRVLKSLGDLVNNFNFIQTEINLEELYEGCCLINELDEYLLTYGFIRVETKLWENGSVGWGDALYIKK
jgi:FkbM family methyltransferase